MKGIKLLLLTLGALVLLVVITLGIFVATFDANAYKQELTDLVKQQTGRQLSFDGDIGLTLYPALGMKLGAMQFANAPGFTERPMLTVNEASISVDLLSILSLTPQVDQLRLDGLTVFLHRNAQGVTNFDDLLVQQPAPTAAEKPPADAGPAADADGPLVLGGSFGGLNISNAQLTWRDDASGDEYQVDIAKLTTGHIEPDAEFPLTLHMALRNKQELRSELQLDAQVSVNERRVQLSSLALTSTTRGDMVPLGEVNLQLSSGLTYALQDQQLALPGFALTMTSQGGAMQTTELSVAGEIGFNAASQVLDIAVLEVQADLVDPSLPKGRINSNLSARDLQLRIADNALDLQGLKLVIDGNTLEGQLKVHDYSRPDLEFTLNADVLDIDRILGPAQQASPDARDKAPEQAAEDVQIALPTELLRQLKLNGLLKVGRLQARNMTFTDASLKVTANNGVINLQPIALKLYQGEFDGAVTLDVQGQMPRYIVSKKLSSFQVGAFLRDFMGEDPVSGAADIDVQLTTQGEWLSQLRAAMNGAMQIGIRDGALKGFNLRHSVESAKARFKGQPAPPQQERKTDFSALSLSGKIKDGVFSSNDLDIQAPLLRVGGQGSADLARETVDYRVDAKLVGTTKGQQGGSADDLSGLLIPVAITGPWLNPKIDVQLDELMKARLDAEKARIRQQVEQEKAALEQKLADEKARLRAAQERKAAAEKAELQKKKELAIAEEKARLEEKKKAEEQKARDKLQDKLKQLF